MTGYEDNRTSRDSSRSIPEEDHQQPQDGRQPSIPFTSPRVLNQKIEINVFNKEEGTVDEGSNPGSSSSAAEDKAFALQVQSGDHGGLTKPPDLAEQPRSDKSHADQNILQLADQRRIQISNAKDKILVIKEKRDDILGGGYSAASVGSGSPAGTSPPHLNTALVLSGWLLLLLRTNRLP